ncbi:MAG: hypothetical protein ABI656_02105, partial [bacterium]
DFKNTVGRMFLNQERFASTYTSYDCLEYFVETAPTPSLLQAASDASSLYRRAILDIMARTNNSAYEAAIKLIRKVGQLMCNLNQASAECISGRAAAAIQTKAQLHQDARWC